MLFKGFDITRTPNFCVPPGGTAGQRLPAPLAGAALIAQRVRFLNRPYGQILKRRPEGRRFLGVLFGFLRRLFYRRQSDHKSFDPWQPCRVAGQGR